MNMCVILNDYVYAAFLIYRYKSVVDGNEEREVTFF
jgi:hypothetical protein